ncbi:MAG: hypothetical protein HY903_18110 [Deltaproteobacteria bacterium]|nr:hypothetical protein [Deltaproteobacteria bacterium]
MTADGINRYRSEDARVRGPRLHDGSPVARRPAPKPATRASSPAVLLPQWYSTYVKGASHTAGGANKGGSRVLDVAVAAAAARRGQPVAKDTPGKSTPAAVTATSHPHLFTAEGERKWKVAPKGVTVNANEAGRGDWIERWQKPGTGKWVYNYTLDKLALKAGEKYAALVAFKQVLPDIRARYRRDLENGGRDSVVALVVALMDKAYFRVGNESSDDQGSFGATTLLCEHVTKIRGTEVTFEFRGKKLTEQHKLICDPLVARHVKALVRGRKKTDRLFQFGGRPIEAREVNRYLDAFGAHAHQFRTFHATRIARDDLAAFTKVHQQTRREPPPPAERALAVVRMFRHVARELGHKLDGDKDQETGWEVARDSYVAPQLVDAFLSGKGPS